MVIARCLGPDQFYLERVVFPFELLSFQCPPESELEIWTHGLGGPELVERIPTGELLMEDGSSTINVAAAALETAALVPEEELTALWQEAG
jgi:hypothetical protein